MLLEIVTPYDGERAGDVFTDYTALFARLSEMTVYETGFGQTEISVVRWRDWDEREDPRGVPAIVLEVDNLT